MDFLLIENHSQLIVHRLYIKMSLTWPRTCGLQESVKDISATRMQSNNGFEGQINACWTHKMTQTEIELIGSAISCFSHSWQVCRHILCINWTVLGHKIFSHLFFLLHLSIVVMFCDMYQDNILLEPKKKKTLILFNWFFCPASLRLLGRGALSQIQIFSSCFELQLFVFANEFVIMLASQW